MKGNCTKLERYDGTGWAAVAEKTSLTGPSRTRETVERELTLECDGTGGSQTKKKSPGTREIGDIEVEILWNPNVPVGTAQVETATGAGTVTGAGNALVTVTSARFSGNRVLNVPVTTGASAVWMAAVRAALAGDPEVNEHFTVGGTGATAVLTSRQNLANDATLNVALATGTATGITAAANSTDTTAGVAGVSNVENHHLFEDDFENETATFWRIRHSNAAGSGVIVHATVKELGEPSYAVNEDVKRSITLEPTGEFYWAGNAVADQTLPLDIPAPEDHWGKD